MSKIFRAIIAVIAIAGILLVAVPQNAKAVPPHKAVHVTASYSSTEYAEYEAFSHVTYPEAVPPNHVHHVNPVSMFYSVRSGDYLSKIASNRRMAWQSLYCENKKVIGSNPDMITVGEKLRFPSVKVTCKIEDGTINATTTTTANSSGGRSSAPPPVATPAGSLQNYALSLLHGSATEFSCLNLVIMRESGWNVYAQNPGSGAYGIPQALPGSKMSVAGSDWATNGYTQLRWMIVFYIPGSYGDPCGAWNHEVSFGWY